MRWMDSKRSAELQPTIGGGKFHAAAAKGGGLK
jgi:hypothetical protein